MPEPRNTRVLPVDVSKVGQFVFNDPEATFLGDWGINLSTTSQDAANLQEAASKLQDGEFPVAFPTETVYGLGADATRSAAVRGVYHAKQRPSDNPLIIHISSLSQLRNLLSSHLPTMPANPDPIPQVYHSLISRFWPGPLTILLPVPSPSPLASEVTNSLATVAVRMPSSKLALALIHLAGFPLAAPSANASSKPSPTTAGHVLFDLGGRIDLILDGGPCEVGVESTVVDGLSEPPVILRPGGISAEMLRLCPGWEDVRSADRHSAEGEAPKAPGMKYKHYSPNARVIIFHGKLSRKSMRSSLKGRTKVGFLWTRTQRDNMQVSGHQRSSLSSQQLLDHTESKVTDGKEGQNSQPSSAQLSQMNLDDGDDQDLVETWTIHLGPGTAQVAQGLFAALREFDDHHVDVIFVEGFRDGGGGVEAAIMNRVRKAAEAEIGP